jgi:hypothetical protein
MNEEEGRAFSMPQPQFVDLKGKAEVEEEDPPSTESIATWVSNSIVLFTSGVIIHSVYPKGSFVPILEPATVFLALVFLVFSIAMFWASKSSWKRSPWGSVVLLFGLLLLTLVYVYFLFGMLIQNRTTTSSSPSSASNTASTSSFISPASGVDAD